MRASKHWLHQRVSALILFLFIPGIWWLFKTINTSSYRQLHLKLSSPMVLLLMSIALLLVLYHARLGLSIIIEDYTQQIKCKILLHAADAFLSLLLLSFAYSILMLLKGI
ncbi:MAG: succinate dehydrogenase, hydrophobic membrane anchor protein [Pseudomonadota bacterium]